MRVLLISYVFPPFGGAGVQRVSKLAEFLVRGGYQVSVVTHDAGLVRDPDLVSKELNHINVLRIPFFNHSDINNDKISLELENFIALQNPEIIFSSSPTIEAHLIAKKLRSKFGAYWIADFRDIQSEYVSPVNYFAWYSISKMERRIFNSCDVVVVISDYYKTYLIKNFTIPDRKIMVMMNGYDASDFSRLSEDKNIKVGLSSTSITLVHVGTFYGRRSPLFLIINSMLVRKKLGVELKIQLVGKMGRSAKLIVELTRKFIPIEVVATVSHTKAIQLMCNADILILVPGWFGAGVITGKVFEYVASCRPVINLYSYKGTLTEILNGVDGVFNVHEFNFMKFYEVLAKINVANLGYNRVDFQKYERGNQYKVIENLMRRLKS